MKSEKKLAHGLLQKAELINNSTEKDKITDKKKDKPKKADRILSKTMHLFVIILLVLIVLLFFTAGLRFGWTKFSAAKKDTSIAMVEKQLSLCQELVTAKYRYSDIVVVKKAMGFSKSYSIVKFSGLLRAGIADITDVSFTISDDGKSISLKIPAAEILGNELTEQDVFDEKQSIFVPITTQEIFDEIETARRQAAENLIADGILSEARNYAVRIITQFMYSAGFETVYCN